MKYKENKTIAVITSIFDIDDKVRSFFSNDQILVIGDKKSIPIKESENLQFYSIEKQESLNLNLFKELPFNHYTRKNIGYIEALKKGATFIYDTDDDNIPNDFWGFPDFNFHGDFIEGIDYFNAYIPFTENNVWPRGFPLNRITKRNDGVKIVSKTTNVGVWQGLADIDPDVDAIYRLIDYAPVNFNRGKPFVLGNRVYCPFNSQNTFWKREMVPYAYLPSTVTFRFTDILRGYVAQRCLWEHNLNLGFTEATVYQERNDHDLMKDFKSEIPCYMQVEEVVSILNDLSLGKNQGQNLIKIYKALSENQIVKPEELNIVKAWVKDLEKVL